MKRIVVITLLLALAGALAAKPAQLCNFVELLNALSQGEDVQMVAHYGRCTLAGEEDTPTPDATGGMNIDTWEYFAPMTMGNEHGFLVFGESQLIANPLGEGYVYNYVRVRVIDDGTVQLTARYLDAQTMEVQMDETFLGSISRGRNDSAPFLFFER